MSVAVKVCCIQTVDEARRAAEAGADFVGLVGAMPSGPGCLTDDRIAAIALAVPRSVTPVLLTAGETARDIAAHVRRTGVGAVQIVRTVPPSVRLRLREILPDVTVLQVVHVEGPSSLGDAMEACTASDYLLLDSGRPSATIPELGGTGRTHDWTVSRRIVAEASVPVLLAGGLGPENVAEAVAAVAPFGVDVCSGLRDPGGHLLPGRLAEFTRALRSRGRQFPQP